MSHHTLQGRTDNELLWFQRRTTLQAAAAWVATTPDFPVPDLTAVEAG